MFGEPTAEESTEIKARFAELSFPKCLGALERAGPS
jgi:hypothetical protein